MKKTGSKFLRWARVFCLSAWIVFFPMMIAEAKVIELGTASDTINILGTLGLGLDQPEAQMQITAPTGEEALRLVSASNWSPLNIRNSADTADIFRVDQSGILATGTIPWARLINFPSACTTGQYVSAVGGTLTCSTPQGASQWTTNVNDIYFNTGNVGIGTTTPTTKLQLYSSSYGAATGLSFGDGDTGIYEGSDDIMYFGVNGASSAGFTATGMFAGVGYTGNAYLLKQVSSNILPAYSFVGDTTTGIGRAGASVGSLIAGGVNVLNWNNSGNVGIGTTSPVQKLDVSGKIALNGTTIAYRPTTFTGTLILGDGGTNLSFVYGSHGMYNTFVGISSGNSNTTGYSNTSIGFESLKNNLTGVDNSAFGRGALSSNTTGSFNTANGESALGANTTGSYNTASGYSSLAFGSGSYNTAGGYNSLTYPSGNYNTAYGYYSLNGVGGGSPGGYNTANGVYSLSSNTTGEYNTANGGRSLSSNNIGSENTAQGYNAGRYITNGSSGNTTGTSSVFIGFDTRAAANGEVNQIVIGATAIGNGSNSVTLGNNSITKTILKGNVGIGTTSPATTLDVYGLAKMRSYSITQPEDITNKSYVDSAIATATSTLSSVWSGTTGGDIWSANSGNVGIGTSSPTQKLDVLGKIALNGTAIAYRPTSFTGTLILGNGGDNITHSSGSQGYYNTYIGMESGISAGSGFANSAMGYESLKNNTQGSYNSAQGYQSLFSSYQGDHNTAQGYQSLKNNSIGDYNSAQGSYALYTNGDGYENSAQGYQSLYSNSNGMFNSAQGSKSLYTNTSGQSNTAQGYRSLYANSTGDLNTAQGSNALYSNTGHNNTAQGASALSSNTTGRNNSAQGTASLYYNTTGSENTAVGYYAGSFLTNGSSGNITGTSSVFIGYDTRAQADGQVNQIVIGATAIGNGSNSVTLGNSNITKTILNGKIGIGAIQPDSKLDVINNNIGVTIATSTGIYLGNTTSAAVNAQQYSPGLSWRGNGWKTTATAASQPVEFMAYLLPVQGTSNPSATLNFASAINNSAFTTRMSIDSAGTLTATSLALSGAISGATTGQFSNTITNTRTALTTTPTDGTIITNTTAALVGSQIQMSPRLRLSGTAWNTGGTPASNTINWTIDTLPAGGNPPTASLRFNYDRNGGGYSTKMSLSDTGVLNITNSISVGTTTPPSAILDVNGLAKMRSYSITQPEDITNKSYVDSAIATATSTLPAVWGGTTGGDIWSTNSGNVGIGTSSPNEKLMVVGNVSADAFYYNSDLNLKKNIRPLTDSLDKILSIRGVVFDWKKGGTNNIGFIAQEVEKVIPELVKTSTIDGSKTMQYGNLTAVLVEAVKEQQDQINDLQEEIRILKKYLR